MNPDWAFLRKVSLLVTFCMGFAAFFGCSTAKTKISTPNARQWIGPVPLDQMPEIQEQAEQDSDPTKVYGPSPVPRKPVVLVFGPGLARGFSYIGVIRALHEKEIPIAAVLGTEMGALVAALYGLSQNFNGFEWGAFHFKPEVFAPKSGFFSQAKSRQGNLGAFEKALEETFSQKDLRNGRVPVKIGAQVVPTGIPVLFEKGKAKDILRAALAVPGLFPESTLEMASGQALSMRAGSATRPFLVKEARKLNLGPVLVVNVISPEESAVAADELQLADLVLEPQTASISYWDFDKKNEAALRGKQAVLESLDEIKILVEGTKESSD